MKPIIIKLPVTRVEVFSWVDGVAQNLQDRRLSPGKSVLTSFYARPARDNSDVIEIHAAHMHYKYDPDSPFRPLAPGGGIDGLSSSIVPFCLEITSNLEAGGEEVGVEATVSCPADEKRNSIEELVGSEAVALIAAALDVYREIAKLIARGWPNSGITQMGEQARARGRRKFKCNEWARKQMAAGKRRDEVITGWIERYKEEIGEDQFNMLADPDKSFDQAVAPMTRK